MGNVDVQIHLRNESALTTAVIFQNSKTIVRFHR